LLTGFESREWEGRGFFELSEVSINELEHRRERGRKNLRKFVSRFPGWLIGENGKLEHEVWGSQAFSFLRKFSDDELVELALVYYGAGMKFDSRTKVILSVVQERL